LVLVAIVNSLPQRHRDTGKIKIVSYKSDKSPYDLAFFCDSASLW
jgi:hypothetical protein